MVTRLRLIVVLLFSISLLGRVAHASLLPSISAVEVQKFEQSYENWVQTLTQTVAPSTPVTVLVELQYSDDQEKLDDYEAALESNHLPGLPEVVDPHYNHPSESPLFTLVSQQKIKVLMEGSLNTTQKKLLNEILNNKLKINAKRGDHLVIQEVNASLLNQFVNSRQRQAAMIVISVLMIAAFGAVQRKRKSHFKAPKISVKVPVKAPTVKQRKQAEELSLKITKMNSKLQWVQHEKTVDPIQFILKAEAKTLLAAVRKEKSYALAHVIQGVNDAVVATILKLCSREQRNEIKDILSRGVQQFSAEKIKYHQLLLAAKVHREAKHVNDIANQMEKLVSLQEQRAKEERQAEALRELILKAAVSTEAKEEEYEDQNLSI